MENFQPCTDPIDPERIKWYKVLQILSNKYKFNFIDAVEIAKNSTYLDCVWFMNTIYKYNPDGFVNHNKNHSINNIFENEANKTKDTRAIFIACAIADIIGTTRLNPVHTLAKIINSFIDEKVMTQWYETNDEYSTYFKSEVLDVGDCRKDVLLKRNLELSKFDNPFTLYKLAHNIELLTNSTNNPVAIKCFKRAADLGHFMSMYFYADRALFGQPEFFTYIGQYMKYFNNSSQHIEFMTKKIYEFVEHPNHILRSSVFRIGEITNGCCKIAAEGQYYKIFNVFCSRGEYSAILYAINFYKNNTEKTKEVINCWVIIGNRLGIVKDVRKIISCLLWQSRYEALYSISIQLN